MTWEPWADRIFGNYAVPRWLQRGAGLAALNVRMDHAAEAINLDYACRFRFGLGFAVHTVGREKCWAAVLFLTLLLPNGAVFHESFAVESGSERCDGNAQPRLLTFLYLFDFAGAGHVCDGSKFSLL